MSTHAAYPVSSNLLPSPRYTPYPSHHQLDRQLSALSQQSPTHFAHHTTGHQSPQHSPQLAHSGGHGHFAYQQQKLLQRQHERQQQHLRYRQLHRQDYRGTQPSQYHAARLPPPSGGVPPPLSSPQPRLMPSQPAQFSPRQHSTTSTHHRPVHHSAVRPSTGRYQPSRGAERDARWQARYADRLPQGRLFNQQLLGPPDATHPQPHAASGQVPPAYAAHVARPTAGVAVRGGGYDPNQVRAEQQAAIALARRVHQENQLRAVQDEEYQRKTKRIQLQVFVHARPTPCAWTGCEALLNSWAVLEKHVKQCHVLCTKRPGGGAGTAQTVCLWEGCGWAFDHSEDCYQHCLVGHMGTFSARCPFNCRFEGDKFADLMAHISRRHPTATPDDFVPGLIHHRPLHLPATVLDLPKLPQLTLIGASSDDLPARVWSCSDVLGASGGISAKVQALVDKSCRSGRHPRKDHYAEKEGAKAAIDAILENSSRITEAYHSTHDFEEEEQDMPEGHVPLASRSVAFTVEEAKSQGAELIDVKAAARTAKRMAKRRIAADPSHGSDCSPALSNGSRPGSSTGARPRLETRRSGPRRQHSSDGKDIYDLSESGTESDTSSDSQSSLYKARKTYSMDSPAASDRGLTAAEVALKRSVRLQLKKAQQGGREQERTT